MPEPEIYFLKGNDLRVRFLLFLSEMMMKSTKTNMIFSNWYFSLLNHRGCPHVLHDYNMNDNDYPNRFSIYYLHILVGLSRQENQQVFSSIS